MCILNNENNLIGYCDNCKTAIYDNEDFAKEKGVLLCDFCNTIKKREKLLDDE